MLGLLNLFKFAGVGDRSGCMNLHVEPGLGLLAGTVYTCMLKHISPIFFQILWGDLKSILDIFVEHWYC